LNALPMGVRRVSTITASGICLLLLGGCERLRH
jgi:hypothetical protein